MGHRVTSCIGRVNHAVEISDGPRRWAQKCNAPHAPTACQSTSFFSKIKGALPVRGERGEPVGGGLPRLRGDGGGLPADDRR